MSNNDLPNILFIMADDHAAHAISSYGSKVNQTPNIDRIAEEGMRFDNCFCVNSICSPSRATILTGKYSYLHGVRTLYNKLDNRQQTYPKILQNQGYETAIIGKWHLGYEDNNTPTGFNYWNVLPGQGEYFDPEMIEMGERQKREGYVTDIITDETLDFLKNRDKTRPFCVMCHHKAPHDPWKYDEKHADLFKDSDIPEPDNLFDDYSTRGEAIKMATQKIGMYHTEYEEETSHLSGKERTKAQYQLYLKSYLRCIASIDDNIGRLLDYLDQEGLADNTIVIYTSDQGFFLGEHGLYDKRFMYEESLRMPFIIRYSEKIKPGSVNEDLISNIDFAPTFIDYAGKNIPEDIQGESLRPLLENEESNSWSDSIYYHYWLHLAHFKVPAHIGVRTKDYKLIYYYGKPLGCAGAVDEITDPEWELFDLNRDPREMNNIYGEEEYKDITRELKKKLQELKERYENNNEISFEI